MQVLTLRTALEELLEDLLGSYTFIGGGTTPAISVRASGEGLPAGTTVSGMEVVIGREPMLAPARVYQLEETLSIWTLYLVGWTPDANLGGAAQLLIYTYPGTTATEVLVPEGLGPSAQMRVTLKTNPDGSLGLPE